MQSSSPSSPIDRSCQAFCGYHDAINRQIFYAVMPWPGCGGCTGNLEPVQALTSTSSHELYEAITDPIPPQVWYDDNWRHLRLEDQGTRRLHDPTRVVEQKEKLRLTKS